MTYKRLQTLVTGLLTGDVVLPSDADVTLSLLEMAMSEVATQAEAMHLMTLNRMNKVTRLSMGQYVVRTPELPSSENAELDIDHELCFPLARIIASYISLNKMEIHVREAKRLITDYNVKVYEILETLQLNEDGTHDVAGTPVIKYTS